MRIAKSLPEKRSVHDILFNWRRKKATRPGHAQHSLAHTHTQTSLVFAAAERDYGSVFVLLICFGARDVSLTGPGVSYLLVYFGLNYRCPNFTVCCLRAATPFDQSTPTDGRNVKLIHVIGPMRNLFGRWRFYFKSVQSNDEQSSRDRQKNREREREKTWAQTLTGSRQ